MALAAAFVAGLAATPLIQFAVSGARAQAVMSLSPAMVDLMAMKHADIPSTPNPEMNSKGIVVTDNATIANQSGNVGKHMHPKTDEIQHIIEGSGAHGGTLVTAGQVKATAIKLPPQPKDDMVFLN